VKTVLIRPSNPTRSGYLTEWGFLPTPLGLLQLAGCLLTLEGSEVKVVDMEADQMQTDRAVDEALRFNPDFVGITIHASAAHKTAARIAHSIKEQEPDTLLVAGGHHATFPPNELLQEGFDVVALGEGDDTIIDIGEAVQGQIQFEDVPGIVFKKDDKCVRTQPRPLIENLDELPFPALDLVQKEKYTARVFGTEDTVTCLETSRGCPYACDFCSVTPTWGSKWRNKSNARILMELDQAGQIGYDWIFFTDDIFVVYPNVKHRLELFQKMIQHDFRFKWIVQMRADVTALNPDLIRLGAEAGMRLAFLGIESGSPEILRKMHKGLFTPQSVKAVRILSENGVMILCGMMLGAPYENFRNMSNTIEFSRKLADAGADAVQFTIYTPLPGTRIFDEALRKNRLFTLDWDRYDVLTPVMKTRVHPALIQMLQYYGNYSFYVRKFLMSRLKPRRAKCFDQNLVSNAQRFIIATLPTYLRDVLSLPSKVASTTKVYSCLAKETLDKVRVDELLQISNKVIYQETGSKNRYFLIQEPTQS
jgi:anaerobic magnesium-protoporphyrin IX monomethyl ester cyclase